jgi:hypothetical protein
MRAVSRVGAVLAAGLVLLVLTGCFSVLHAAQTFVAPDDMRDPAPAPRAISTLRPEAPAVSVQAGSEVGYARITSPHNRVSGFIRVLVNGGGGYSVRFDDYLQAGTSPLVLVMTAEHIDLHSNCNRTSQPVFAAGDVSSLDGKDLVLASADSFRRGDPSYFKDFVLLDPAAATPGCLSAIAAVAPIRWTMPDMNPGFFVYDTGATDGARGVTTMAGGRPSSYTVVQDDLLPQIAARFGITVDDLLWLNPTREEGSGAQVDEVLNLVRSGR